MENILRKLEEGAHAQPLYTFSARHDLKFSFIVVSNLLVKNRENSEQKIKYPYLGTFMRITVQCWYIPPCPNK